MTHHVGFKGLALHVDLLVTEILSSHAVFQMHAVYIFEKDSEGTVWFGKGNCAEAVVFPILGKRLDRTTFRLR